MMMVISGLKDVEMTLLLVQAIRLGLLKLNVLTNHPAVKECAVVAKPHDIRGNIVKAFVILQDHTAGDDTLVKELQQFVKNEVAPYKYPREIEFVDDLPKTNSGKIRRVERRDAEIEKWQQQKDSNQ